MISLVANIQMDLQQRNENDAEFRVAVMSMVNRNTGKINGIASLLETLGWPLGRDTKGRSYIQTEQDRKIFNAEQLKDNQ